MTMQFLPRAMRIGSAAMILAGLLGAASLASAAIDAKKPAPAAPKPAAKAPAPARPSGGGASHTTTGASHTTTTTTHTTTTTTHSATTTGGATTHGPTTGGATTHGPTTGGATTHGPTTGGAATTHGPTTAGAATHGPTNAGAASHTTSTTMHTTSTTTRTTTTTTHSTIHSGPAPRGSNEHVTHTGSAVRTRPNGRVSDVHDAHRGMDVHHGLAGGRRVSMERHDGSRVYSERGRPGYVERGYHYGGHDFARRAYFYHGHEYNRFYMGYGYHGLFLNVYAPGFYFHPGFYGWAYNPWVAPITFGWGWGGSPWYGRYGYYFQPYPVYPSAAFWLTDYIISQNLQAAYAAQQEAGEAAPAPEAASGGQPVLTPEVKQMIADEVKAQLALENQEAQQNAQGAAPDPASSGIARLLSDGHPHVFVAGGSLDVTDASGNECVVSDGDALQLQQPPPSDATSANLVVLSSKGRPECQISLTVQVQLTDLQEMQNHMRETIDQGLQDLQSKQGTGGLPSAPPSAQGDAAPAAYAAAAPPPEANVAADIQGADQQAGQAEKDVTAEAAQDNSGAASAAPAAAPAAPASVSLGQTQDEVEAEMGQPTSKALLGSKVIYNYNGMKVIFKNGKVSDVQ
ncbi:MAG: hypothetical protein ABR924_00015 [Terracidiphilus sp.]